MHRTLLAELDAAGEIDWPCACEDGFHVRAKKEEAATVPSPVDRRQTGSNYHLICDGKGMPPYVITTAANAMSGRSPVGQAGAEAPDAVQDLRGLVRHGGWHGRARCRSLQWWNRSSR
ncbi:hypothetical protein ACFWXK_10900 [Streptomyces sp. NPDC059070]|uniref:hypothetical protein n=1 Tax=unclassified Streptomyces TaxID=2593676 RepID=UPI0034E1B9F7